jgi:catechol 2,3-dioxygenase
MSVLDGETPAWQGLHADTIMGHIHLHVSALPESRVFYNDVLRMETMMDLESYGALFMSYEAYHHHVGANTWAGRVPPPPDALGLEKYELHVPDTATFDAILDGLEEAEIPVKQENGAYLLEDPSKNRIVLKKP